MIDDIKLRYWDNGSVLVEAGGWDCVLHNDMLNPMINWFNLHQQDMQNNKVCEYQDRIHEFDLSFSWRRIDHAHLPVQRMRARAQGDPDPVARVDPLCVWAEEDDPGVAGDAAGPGGVVIMPLLSPTIAIPRALTITNKYKRSCVLTYDEQRELVKELKRERP